MGDIDTWRGMISGIPIRVDIDPDDGTTPLDSECYGADMLEAWQREEWRYVDVTVSLDIPGIDRDVIGDSLCAVEYGQIPGIPEITTETIATQYPVPEMIDQAMVYAAELHSRLTAILTTWEAA